MRRRIVGRLAFWSDVRCLALEASVGVARLLDRLMHQPQALELLVPTRFVCCMVALCLPARKTPCVMQDRQRSGPCSSLCSGWSLSSHFRFLCFFFALPLCGGRNKDPIWRF